MANTLHLFLKFPNEKLFLGEIETDTITEHIKVYEANNRLIWGQESNKTISGVAKKNRDRIQDQIRNGIDTYSFFLANSNGKRELFVGKIINIYNRGEIIAGSSLIKYIPSYYASHVGTVDDRNNLFVDITTFFKVDFRYIDNITIESSGNKIPFDNNTTPTFLVNINIELDNLLSELLHNPETNFQYQVEQEDVSDNITIDDQPKDKPLKTSSTGSNSYKRDSKTSKKAIVLSDYLCEIDPTHKNFISKVTKENYVEAHHLIPMEFQDDFDKSIDVEANIVSLCVSCHKKLHHAENEVIQPLIEKLYNDRIDRLNACDLKLTKDKLLRFYK